MTFQDRDEIILVLRQEITHLRLLLEAERQLRKTVSDLRDVYLARAETATRGLEELRRNNDPASYSSMVYWREHCYAARGRADSLQGILSRVTKEYDDYVESVSGTGEPDPKFRERFPALVEALKVLE